LGGPGSAFPNFPEKPVVGGGTKMQNRNTLLKPRDRNVRIAYGDFAYSYTLCQIEMAGFLGVDFLRKGNIRKNLFYT